MEVQTSGPKIHSTAAKHIQTLVDRLKDNDSRRTAAKPFEDALREFSRSYPLQGTIRNWLTLPVEERKRFVKNDLQFIPQGKGDPANNVKPEADAAFEQRQRDRRLALGIIIQEEARAKAGVRSLEVAAGAFRQLFPDYEPQGRK